MGMYIIVQGPLVEITGTTRCNIDIERRNIFRTSMSSVAPPQTDYARVMIMIGLWRCILEIGV